MELHSIDLQRAGDGGSLVE